MLFGMSLVYGFTGSLQLGPIAERLAALGNEPARGDERVPGHHPGSPSRCRPRPSLLGPRHLRGLPGPGGRLPIGRLQGGRVRRPAPRDLRGLPVLRPLLGAEAFAVLAAFTMLLGNVIALAQTNIVRLLAYSSVAQAGYMLGAVRRGSSANPDVREEAFQAILVYLLIYAFTNLGAFAVVTLVVQPAPALQPDRRLRRPGPPLPGPRRGHDGVPVLPGRHPPGRRLVRQVRDLQVGYQRRHPDPAAPVVVFMAVMTVVALFYYAGVARSLWLGTPPEAPRGLRPAPSPRPSGTATSPSPAGVWSSGSSPTSWSSTPPCRRWSQGP